MSRQHATVGFLLSQFPEMHETFILREFLGFEKADFNFRIYSYKECRDDIVHPQAEHLMGRVRYAPRFELGSLFYWLAHRPFSVARAYATSVLRYVTKPLDFVKANGTFIRSMNLARLMEQDGVQHIHAHWATMPTTGAQIIAAILGIAFSFTAHAWDIFLTDKKELTTKIRQAAFVVTCTEYNRCYLQKLCGNAQKNVFRNYHGMDTEFFSGRQTRDPPGNLILAIGRLVEQKGFYYLIKACQVLKDAGVPFQCVIVGDGPLRSKLETNIVKLGLQTSIEIKGKTTQSAIRDFFDRASVFAMPCVVSRNGDRDGIPNVLLEALAMGVPTVSTDVSGVPEVVIDGVTGLVVPPRDAPALAKALERVLSKPADMDHCTRNGRALVVKMFDLDTNVQELIRLFDQVL